MILDDLLLAIIVAGGAFAGAYLRAEYGSHRRRNAAEREKWLQQLELHSARLRPGQNKGTVA
jgi:hypothetical protein